MLNNLKKNNKGFTIIEVMIVLAIAGLIILVVLLAVPALQRNGRNTAMKNNVSAVVGAISEYESNNDGQPPTGVTGAPTTGVVTIAGVSGSTTAKVQPGTIINATAATAPAATAPAVSSITVVTGHKCENAAGVFAAGVTGQTNGRAMAVYYSVEVGGTATGLQQKCQNA